MKAEHIKNVSKKADKTFGWTKETRYWNGFDMKVIEVLLHKDSKCERLSITDDYYLRSWKTVAEPAAKMIEHALEAASRYED